MPSPDFVNPLHQPPADFAGLSAAKMSTGIGSRPVATGQENKIQGPPSETKMPTTPTRPLSKRRAKKRRSQETDEEVGVER